MTIYVSYEVVRSYLMNWYVQVKFTIMIPFLNDEIVKYIIKIIIMYDYFYPSPHPHQLKINMTLTI